MITIGDEIYLSKVLTIISAISFLLFIIYCSIANNTDKFSSFYCWVLETDIDFIKLYRIKKALGCYYYMKNWESYVHVVKYDPQHDMIDCKVLKNNKPVLEFYHAKEFLRQRKAQVPKKLGYFLIYA
jgi:hypothetical protein